MVLKRVIFLLIFLSCSRQDSIKVTYIEPYHYYTPYEISCIDAINAIRADNGLNALILHNGLSELAKGHADYLALNGVVNHDNFGDRLYAAKGMGFESLSENIAYGYTNVKSLVNAWLNSLEHKEVLLDDRVTFDGFAIGIDSDGRYYYVQLFSHR